MERWKIAGAAGLIIAAIWYVKPGAAVDVAIPLGLSASQTAALLKEKGVLNSTFLFHVTAKITGADRHLKPGFYHLRRHEPILWVLRALQSGAPGFMISIPEGFSAQQIADRLQANGVCKADDFLNYVKVHHLEGYLFPTSYALEPNTGAEKAAQRMLVEFDRRVKPAYAAANPAPTMTLEQVLTLASIVEREAEMNEERPLIAAVYLNRLRLRMRLEADPTVQYALGYWKKGLTSHDLKFDSPYNTYMHYGLPPGPICNPGIGSFLAVLKPTPTKALYFVADNKGGHIFTETHEEHLKAKMAFKRGQREIKARLKEKQDQEKSQATP